MVLLPHMLVCWLSNAPLFPFPAAESPAKGKAASKKVDVEVVLSDDDDDRFVAGGGQQAGGGPFL